MESSKETLRRAMQAQRAALDAETPRLAGHHLATCLAAFAPYLDAAVVLAYAAKDREVPTDGVVDGALRLGKRVFLPCVREGWFREYTSLSQVARGPGGVMEPLDGAALDERERRGIVLVPLLAWSRRGDRLGRGGGWYDRVLPRLNMPTVGVGYGFQEREHVPTEPLDVRLDYVVTENRMVKCGWVPSCGRLS